MTSLVVVLAVLTLAVCALVFLVVWRDRRELKFNEMETRLARVEELIGEAQKLKDEIEKMLTAARKQTDFVVSQVEGQVKQVKNSVASLEQQLHLVGQSGEKRSKNQGPRNKSKAKGNKEAKQQKAQSGSKGLREEPVKINDGERYAKLYELAEQGLSTQEIARQLNMGHDEVELVLELKRKRLS
jgi:paraquat-inducible protein B